MDESTILRIEVFPSLRPPPRGIYCTNENYLKTIFPIRSIKVSPLYPKQLYRSVQYRATAPKSTTTVCPVHNFPPPSELLVCYQPHRQTVMPGQKSIYETFLVFSVYIVYCTDSEPLAGVLDEPYSQLTLLSRLAVQAYRPASLHRVEPKTFHI